MTIFYKSPLFDDYCLKAGKSLKRWHREKKYYFIYGAGIHSRELFRKIKINSPYFLGFIDQSLSKQKEGFLGFPVFPIEEAIKTEMEAILISSYEYQENMRARILETGKEGLEMSALYPIQEQKDTYNTYLDPVLTVSKKGRKIAVVDTFFSWPPIGGSSVDLAAVMNRLARSGFHVAFFLPVMNDSLYYPRGRVNKREEMGFDLYHVPLKSEKLNPEYFTEEIAGMVDRFEPEFVFLGDMYAFKPYLAERFKIYKTVWRSYNYDLICPRFDLLDRERRICSNSFLADPEGCRRCVMEDPEMNWDQPIFREMHLAHPFSEDYRELLHRNLERAHNLIVYNQIIKKKLVEVFPKHQGIQVIPSGIDPDFFHQGQPDAKEITILFPGRLEDPAKGLDFFLPVFRRLRDTYPNVRLLTTGKFDVGVEGVESAGWIPYDKMPELYQRAHICVFPSLWEEPFGIAALESMASGIPVVANAVGGFQETVLDGETGFLVPPGDGEKFLESLTKLITDESLRKEMGGNGQIRARKFSWDNVMKKYEKIFGVVF